MEYYIFQSVQKLNTTVCWIVLSNHNETFFVALSESQAQCSEQTQMPIPAHKMYYQSFYVFFKFQ